MGTARRYLTLRLIAPSILILHLGIRAGFGISNSVTEVGLYNAVALFAALTAFSAPIFNDRLATRAMGFALLLWGSGSFITSWNSHINYQLLPALGSLNDFAYVSFYPFALFALIRILSSKQSISKIELLDVLIIALGISAITASLLLKPAMLHFDGSASSVFFTILYPIGDLGLVSVSIVAALLQPKSVRQLLFLCGVAIFTACDLYFLYQYATSGYQPGSLVDDGWLLGLVVMAESLWHKGGERELSQRFAANGALVALILSAGLLAAEAVWPAYFPSFVLIPALLTITLAIVRVALASTVTRLAQSEGELARIDELTGLANRRRLLAEIDLLKGSEGSLLLLDLDGFKAVNDQMGHQMGDELLKVIAVRFTRALSHGALLARLGGDEFGVVVYGPPSHGLEVAQALRASLSYPIALPGGAVTVGVSIGRVVNDGSDEILRRADSAMYEAKRSGVGLLLWRA